MSRFKTLKVLEGELGEVLKSGLSGASLYYSIHWEELYRQASEVLEDQGVSPAIIEDVRSAGHALDVLGIPSEYSEADLDENGDWIVYWR